MRLSFFSRTQALHKLKDLYINKNCTPRATCIEFDTAQKTLLLSLFRELPSQYNTRPDIVYLILLGLGSYWDYPFTVGTDCIVLTPRLLTKPSHNIKCTLIHELVHLDQRRSPEKYDIYYRTLGFRKAYINLGILKPYVLKNPDAIHYEWVFSINTINYIPVALLLNCKIYEVLLEMRGNDVIKIHRIKDVPRYHQHFGTVRQLYHPNEIVAHLISDHIMEGKSYTPIDYVQLGSLYKDQSVLCNTV